MHAFRQIRFSIRTKLFCGIVVPAAILMVVIYLDYANLSALGRTAETILAKNYKSIEAAYRMSQVLRSRQGFMVQSLLKPQESGQAVLQSSHNLDNLLDICWNNITEVGEKEVLDDIGLVLPQYQQLFSSLHAALAGKKPWAREGYQKLTELQQSLSANLDQLILINEQAMKRAELETSNLAAKAKRYSISLLVVAIIFVLGFSAIISRRISKPLVDLAGGLARVKKDGREYPEFPVGSRDEIGFLTTEFNRLFERLREYDQSNLEILSAEKAKVRAAEKAKSRFIADLSHQLKTPMTSLSMAIGVLVKKIRGDLPQKYAGLLDTAQDDCSRLAALANELVDVSRMEAMAKPRPKEKLDVADLVAKCLKPLALQAGEKGVRLITDVQPGLPLVAMDSFRFPWVITNLVGNALRYTPSGGRINLEVARRADSMVFVCRDTGAGIDPQYLPHVFDRYAQFSEREAMGTIGLGLAIVKEIIEQHGGDITVSSQPKRGATFTFWIPIGSESDHEPVADS
jgi:signal transduction histidine kinase